jgi:two-component system cell cycle sensor histidine kinase PleC
MRTRTARDDAQQAVGPRVLVTRLDRRTEAAARTATGTPAWIILTALLCSEGTGFFGSVSVFMAGLCVALAILVSSLVFAGLYEIRRQSRLAQNEDAIKSSLRRAFQLDLLMSTFWGVVPWLLWEPGNIANHLFLELILLSVGVRFLVSRAASMDFFVVSFGPMAAMLFLRLAFELNPADLVLASLIPFYAASLVLDARRHTTKSFTDAQLRFGMEDMARELETARDGALKGRAEAEEANRSKTAFLANMSHELRTPLNAILGFSEIIAHECLGPVGSPRYREYAHDIHSSGTHLLSLINDLLDVAKIESGKMEISPSIIQTRSCLENALKFVAMRARDRKQVLSIDVDGPANLVFADERAIRQIVINLASNSVKFTPEGGRIEVRARLNERSEFELRVWDDGPGIPKEKLDQVFKPFTQVNNQFDRGTGGTGLGLALVRGLAELHGGRAWIESERGKGTFAYVTLPSDPGLARKRATG